MGVYQQACEKALTASTQDSKSFGDLLPLKFEEEPYELTTDSNSTCILCEYMMNILANYIHSQSTEEEIEKGLQKVCSQMPATLQKQCQELIDDYGPPIIATLIREFDVSTICRKLNLCTNQMKVELSHVTKANLASCGVCDYVSTYINFALKRDSSDKSLKHALSTVCTHLSSQQTSQCQTLVQLFSPHIRKLQLQLENNFCKQLGICQTTEDKTNEVKSKLTKEEEDLKNRIVKNLDDTPECQLCHYVITYLDAVLKTNKSAAAIEAALEKVCTILPAKERAQCDQFVKTYGPVLAELIAQTADPDTVCRYLGVCQVTLPKETSTKKPITYPNHDYVSLSNEETQNTCTICQFIIGRMKRFVTLNQTEEEILVSLKNSCDLFTVIKLKEQCESFLDQYGPYIIQMISSDVQPKIACQSLGICVKDAQLVTPSTRRQSTPPVPISSTAYGKCIFGISYWCTSRQNAELCNVNRRISRRMNIDFFNF
jgi:saposin